MARTRKREEEGPKGLPGWMATFSDMVTLLLTFFVLLLSMASFDETSRVDAVMESIRAALGTANFRGLVGQSEKKSYVSDVPKSKDHANPIVAKLRDGFRDQLDSNKMDFQAADDEVRLRLDDRLFFEEGSAQLHPSTFGLIQNIVTAVKDHDDLEVEVIGHTDASGDSFDNWQLSSDRATAVVTAMARRGVPGGRLAAVGKGEYAPGVDRRVDPEWNRRIEVVISGPSLSVADVVENLDGAASD